VCFVLESELVLGRNTQWRFRCFVCGQIHHFASNWLTGAPPNCRACRLASGEALGESYSFQFPLGRKRGTDSRLQEYFKNDTLALIGYGSQGHGQGLNLRDNGLNVIIGVRKNGKSWKDAEQDGWVAGKNLFDVDEAISRGTIVMNLLSDAAQSETWPAIKPQLVKGKVRFSSAIHEWESIRG
jgi:hypothetical protein